MSVSSLGSCALTSFLAVAMLAGCDGSQPPIGAPGAIPQSLAITTHTDRSKSWMLPEAKSEGLIYATGACEGTCVLSYPAAKLVGTLTAGDAGDCADRAGNVYVAEDNSLLKYAHGGTEPIATLVVSGGIIGGCSVDPTSGDIAATVGQSSSYNVAIFSSGSGSPVTYLISDLDAQFCGYDDKGNLFVDGYGHDTALYELPAGGSEFANISLASPVSDTRPGQVQWDGSYLTVEGLGVVHGVVVYRLTITGSDATLVGTTTFKGVTRNALQSWIVNDQIFIPYGSRGSGGNKTQVGVWKYPAGGKAAQKIKGFIKRPDIQGVAFSAS